MFLKSVALHEKDVSYEDNKNASISVCELFMIIILLFLLAFKVCRYHKNVNILTLKIIRLDMKKRKQVKELRLGINANFIGNSCISN